MFSKKFTTTFVPNVLGMPQSKSSKGPFGIQRKVSRSLRSRSSSMSSISDLSVGTATEILGEMAGLGPFLMDGSKRKLMDDCCQISDNSERISGLHPEPKKAAHHMGKMAGLGPFLA